jgi:hypothetical protein
MSFALLGSAVGMFTGMVFGASKAAVLGGLWGYNSVLACIAIGGMFFVPSWKTTLLAGACAVLCAVLQGAFVVLLAPVGMATLTFPFCLGAIVFNTIGTSLPSFVPVSLASMTTPEEHWRTARDAARALLSSLRVRRRRALARLRTLWRGFGLVDPLATVTGTVSLASLRAAVQVSSVAGDAAKLASTLALVETMSAATDRRLNATQTRESKQRGRVVHFFDVFVLGPNGGRNAVMDALEDVVREHMRTTLGVRLVEQPSGLAAWSEWKAEGREPV